MRAIAVVLAGGTSRRFGTDKLAARLAGVSLLERAIADIPEEWPVVVVGPERPLSRPAVFTREIPAGAGPAAALVAGARVAALRCTGCMVSVPGDVPAGGQAARQLVSALADSDVDACVGVDEHGVEQPLQLAVRGAALTRLAETDPASVVGASARSLLVGLDALQVRLPPRWTLDIDTPDQIALWSKL
ncbi:hypothetical protein GCM10009841_08770 [Microlunatus panaciterrae]|uniref:Molybdopterin-guanine dinucleotide biosynthesis protein A n=1 Tax=Microlunatus panaciterrae TaxID=400768 RepID=A0ABS2RK84_9ACTN|nr:molybdopterin-guanine dinucleotide biosynthesis protein A [Microlunatus panaciterrae]